MRCALYGHARVGLGASPWARRRAAGVASARRNCAAAAAASVDAPPSIITPALREIARQVQSGERSAADVTEEWLARLEGAEPGVRAFISVDAAGARAAAAALDARIAAGESVGPLAGVPIGVKVCEAERGWGRVALDGLGWAGRAAAGGGVGGGGRAGGGGGGGPP